MLAASEIAVQRCESEVSVPLRSQDPAAPTLSLTTVQSGCAGVAATHDTYRHLTGRSRDTDQALHGLTRVAEDARILELELATQPVNAFTMTGAVDHIVKSTPAVLTAIRGVAARTHHNPWSSPTPVEVTHTAAGRELERLHRSIASDTQGLLPGLESLGYNNRSSPVRVRTRMLEHTATVTRIRLDEAEQILAALRPLEPDETAPHVVAAKACLQAARQSSASFSIAVEAYAHPDGLTPQDWTRLHQALIERTRAQERACSATTSPSERPEEDDQPTER